MNDEKDKEYERDLKIKQSLIISWSITIIAVFVLILNTIALYVTLDVFTKKTLEIYNLKSSVQIVNDKFNYYGPIFEDFYDVMHYSNLKDIIEYDPNVELFGNLY